MCPNLSLVRVTFMPYFVFHLSKGTNGKIKDIELQDQFEDYKQAKRYARTRREELQLKDPSDIKIMFSEHVDHAEHRLLENRDAPILREWEK